MDKPEFDPNKPFGAGKPEFDPNAAFQPSQVQAAPVTPVADPRLQQLQAQRAQLQAPQEAPGMLKSAALGAEQGATADFAPRINAGLMAAYRGLTQQADVGKEYEKELKDQEKTFKDAQAAHPWAYGAGNVAGFILPTAATGGENLLAEGSLAGAAKAGATYGALSGVGGSEDLTNLPDVAKNAAAGAITGGVAGGAGSAAMDVLVPYLKGGGQMISGVGRGIANLDPVQDFGKAYATSAAQGNVVGKKAAGEAIQGASESLDQARQIFNVALNNAQQQAESLRGNAPPIDFNDFYKHITQAAKKGIKNSNFQDDADAIRKVHGIVSDFLLGTTDEDGNVIRQGTGMQVSPEDAMDLKRKLGALGSEGDNPLNNKKGLAFANRILSPLQGRSANAVESSFGLPDEFVPLRDTINNAIDKLPENQRDIHHMLDASDDFPDLNVLLNAQKQGTRTSVEAQNALNNFYNSIPDNVATQIKPLLDTAAQKAGAAEAANVSGLSTSVLGGKGMFSKLGSMTGSTVGAANQIASNAGQQVASSGTGKLFQKMFNAPAQTFAQYGNQLAQSADPAMKYVGNALVGAAQKDNFGRNAVIFALSQNPAYRDALEKQFGSSEGIENEGPASSTGQLVNQPQ